MASDAESFESDLECFREFVDDEGRHLYVVQFRDGSGRVLERRPSDDGRSIAAFTVRDGFAMEGMRRIASATDFEVDEAANTQQNLRDLLRER